MKSGIIAILAVCALMCTAPTVLSQIIPIPSSTGIIIIDPNITIITVTAPSSTAESSTGLDSSSTADSSSTGLDSSSSTADSSSSSSTADWISSSSSSSTGAPPVIANHFIGCCAGGFFIDDGECMVGGGNMVNLTQGGEITIYVDDSCSANGINFTITDEWGHQWLWCEPRGPVSGGIITIAMPLRAIDYIIRFTVEIFGGFTFFGEIRVERSPCSPYDPDYTSSSTGIEPMPTESGAGEPTFSSSGVIIIPDEDPSSSSTGLIRRNDTSAAPHAAAATSMAAILVAAAAYSLA